MSYATLAGVSIGRPHCSFFEAGGMVIVIARAARIARSGIWGACVSLSAAGLGPSRPPVRRVDNVYYGRRGEGVLWRRRNILSF